MLKHLYWSVYECGSCVQCTAVYTVWKVSSSVHKILAASDGSRTDMLIDVQPLYEWNVGLAALTAPLDLKGDDTDWFTVCYAQNTPMIH